MAQVAELTAPAPWTVTSDAPVALEPPRAALDAKWDLLLVCVAGYILTAVGRIHQVFPALQSLRPAVLTGLLAIALYLIDRRAVRRSHLLWGRTTKCLIALLAWMALSVPGALVVGNSFDLVANNFIKTVLMYLIVAGAVRGPRDVERLAGVYLVGATVYAAIVLTRFDLGGDWRLGRLYYYDANDFATFVVTAMPLALFALHAGRRTAGRVSGAVALAVLALAFVRTGSRGGFVALVVVVAFIVLRYSAIPLRRRATAAALVAVVVAGTASEHYWNQMSTILSDADYNRTDESGRMQIWRRGVGYMLQYPVFGVGPHNFQTAEGTLSPFADRQQFGVGVRWNAAHNSFVQAGAELGVPGLVFFVAMIGAAFGALRRAGRYAAAQPDPQRAPELAQALTASLIGFVVGACFLSLAYAEMLYTLLAFAVGLQKVTVGDGRVWRQV